MLILPIMAKPRDIDRCDVKIATILRYVNPQQLHTILHYPKLEVLKILYTHRLCPSLRDFFHDTCFPLKEVVLIVDSRVRFGHLGINVVLNAARQNPAVELVRRVDLDPTLWVDTLCSCLAEHAGDVRSQAVSIEGQVLQRASSEDLERLSTAIGSNHESITSLTIGNVDDALLASLLNHMTRLPRLRFFCFCHGPLLEVQAAKAVRIFLDGAGGKLEHLRFVGIDLEPPSVQHLFKGMAASCPSVETLEIGSCYFEDVIAARSFAPFFRQSTSLKSLHFYDCTFSEDNNFPTLLEGIEANTSIVHLEISQSRLGHSVLRRGLETEVDGKALGSLLQNHAKIESLTLNKNHPLRDEVMDGFAAIAHQRLKVILLSNCGVGATGLRSLQPGVHSLLKVLNLGGNALEAAGMQYVASFLADTKCVLESLTLKSCALDDDALAALVSGLEHNETLKSLDLNSNDLITSEGWKILARALPKLTILTELKLVNREADSALYDEFVDGIRRNRSLTRMAGIRLRGSGFDFQLKLSLFAKRNRLLPIATSTKLALGLWPHLLIKTQGSFPNNESIAVKYGSSLTYCILNSCPEVFSRAVVTSRPKKRQKL